MACVDHTDGFIEILDGKIVIVALPNKGDNVLLGGPELWSLYLNIPCKFNAKETPIHNSPIVVVNAWLCLGTFWFA